MSDMEKWLNEQDRDFNPAKAGDDPIWLGGMKYVRADRIEELEAKLKRAEVSLRVINALDPDASMDGCSRDTLITIVGLMGGKARDALAKLTGGKNE